MKLMNLIMLSCKRATELVEKKSVDSLSFTENLQLNLHTMFCKTCKAYEKQSQAIDKTLSKWMKNKEEKTSVHLSENIKSKILKEIKNS